jgi:hypothetical protein
MFCNIFITVPSSLLHHSTNHLANFSDTLYNTPKMNYFLHNAIFDITQSLTHDHYAQHFNFNSQSTLCVKDQITYKYIINEVS